MSRFLWMKLFNSRKIKFVVFNCRQKILLCSKCRLCDISKNLINMFIFLNLKLTVYRIIRSKLFFIIRFSLSFSKKINLIFIKIISCWIQNSINDFHFSVCMIDFCRTNVFIVIEKIMYSNVSVQIFKMTCSTIEFIFMKKKIYLDFFREKTFHIRMWIDCNQRDCVIIFEKFNEMIFFLHQFLFNLIRFNNQDFCLFCSSNLNLSHLRKITSIRLT